MGFNLPHTKIIIRKKKRKQIGLEVLTRWSGYLSAFYISRENLSGSRDLNALPLYARVINFLRLLTDVKMLVLKVKQWQ